MIDRPLNLEDKIGGKVQIEHYTGTDLNLTDWELTQVLDDVLMVQYSDVNDSGTEVTRGGIVLPIGAVELMWRVAKVIKAGPNCKLVKEGNHVVFPNDRGLQVSNLNGLKNIAFLNESRIFGIVSPKQ